MMHGGISLSFLTTIRSYKKTGHHRIRASASYKPLILLNEFCVHVEKILFSDLISIVTTITNTHAPHARSSITTTVSIVPFKWRCEHLCSNDDNSAHVRPLILCVL